MTEHWLIIILQFTVILQNFNIFVFSIVNHEILLTPNHDLELSGKHTFYEDAIVQTEPTTNGRNNQITNNGNTISRPWEHTLKHVIYLTLLTNDENNGLMRENLSHSKSYIDFQRSVYIPNDIIHDTRFGDIVTLAQGHLELMSNGSYRFLEDDYTNASFKKWKSSKQVKAWWLVEKIRHHDSDRRYIYDIRFSVSFHGPLNIKSNSLHRHDWHGKKIFSFIQKQQDYPNSFKQIFDSIESNTFSRNNSDNDILFKDNHANSIRNFRQTNFNRNQVIQHSKQQPKFRLERLLLPPPLPLPPTSLPLLSHTVHDLNIGEYFKDNNSIYTKFPMQDLLNLVLGQLDHTTQSASNTWAKYVYPSMTSNKTYLTDDPLRFKSYYQQPKRYTSLPPLPVRIDQTPLITHHFHHYYYLSTDKHNPLTTESNQGFDKFKIEDIGSGADFFNSNYLKDYQKSTQSHPRFSFTDIEKQQIVHIIPDIKPQIMKYENNQMINLPYHMDTQESLLILPDSIEEDKFHKTTKNLFKESELDTGAIRYSEPDPLYRSTNFVEQNSVKVESQHNFNTLPTFESDRLPTTIPNSMPYTFDNKANNDNSENHAPKTINFSSTQINNNAHLLSDTANKYQSGEFQSKKIINKMKIPNIEKEKTKPTITTVQTEINYSPSLFNYKLRLDEKLKTNNIVPSPSDNIGTEVSPGSTEQNSNKTFQRGRRIQTLQKDVIPIENENISQSTKIKSRIALKGSNSTTSNNNTQKFSPRWKLKRIILRQRNNMTTSNLDNISMEIKRSSIRKMKNSFNDDSPTKNSQTVSSKEIPASFESTKSTTTSPSFKFSSPKQYDVINEKSINVTLKIGVNGQDKI